MKALGNRLINFYEYIFYKTYTFIRVPSFGGAGWQYVVVIAMSCFLCDNFIFVLSLYDLFAGDQSLGFFSNAKNWFSFLFMPAFFMNYFIFLYKDRYEKIFEYYESRVQVKVGDALAWTYIFFSMFGAVFVVPLKIIIMSFAKII